MIRRRLIFGLVFLTAGTLSVISSSLGFSHRLLFVQEGTNDGWTYYYLDSSASDFAECLFASGVLSIACGVAFLAGSTIPAVRRRNCP
jgi:hypothetical protein